jgi:hypothetical protein
VYVANNRLYRRNLHEYDAYPIPGTDEDPASPAFSPNGESLVYFSASEQAIKRIPVAGGTSIPIVSDPSNRPRGIRWEANGMIYYTAPTGIWSVSEDGGQPEHIIPEEGNEVSMSALLPDGEHILFMVAESGAAPDTAQIVAESLDSHVRTIVWPAGGAQPRYVPETGHLIFMFGNDLFAVPFDPDTLTVTGTQTAVVPGIARFGQGADYDVSESGTLVYVPGSGLGTPIDNIPLSNLVFLDRQGNVDEVLSETSPRYYLHPQLSPDDMRVAVTVADADGTGNVYIYDLATDQLNQLTYEGGDIPLWSPDGTEVIFRKDNSLWTIPSDRSAAGEMLTGTGLGRDPPLPLARFIRGSFSPDGSVMLFVSDEGIRAWEPGSTQDETVPQVIVPNREGFLVAVPQFSPDGGWFVYARAGGQLYMDTYPPTNQRSVTDAGALATFVSDTGELISVVQTTGLVQTMVVSAPLTLGNPARMFNFDFPVLDYDVTSDGDRFIVAMPIELTQAADDETPDTTDAQVNIVQNWFEELKELVPVP